MDRRTFLMAVPAVAAAAASSPPPEFCDATDDSFRNKWCPCQVFDADGVELINVQRCNLRTGWVEYVWVDAASVVRHSSEFRKAPLTLRST